MTTANYLVHYRLWLAVLLGLGAAACASDKSLVSHKLNNLAARDNGYFLAREKLYETEAALYKGRANDYNQVLALYPTLDSGTVKAARADLNDIIKKASLPIQNRPGSDWTDDSYLLVGWARFYKMEFDDAEKTFKYTNSTSKDPYAKQEALIGLMRTFMLQKRLDDAQAVSAILDKQRGLEKDARELFLARADYYLQTKEPKLAIAQLEKAVPLIPLKNERLRTRYILAQLYQAQGDDKKAAEQLNNILKHNPPYELDFYSKLLLGQVLDLNSQSKERLDKYFAGLLKDPKNKEYRDKIYYEMGRLQYRQQHYGDALALLRSSAKQPTTSKSQKGYTYWLAGRIYYENLQKYSLAAAYYDSTTQAMPKENLLYAGIKERADFLREFAKQYTIIQTQDSLQALAKLPTDELDKHLTAYATAELEAQRKAAEKAQAAKDTQAKQQRDQASRISSSGTGFGGGQMGSNPGVVNPSFDATTTVATGTQWYFDNPTSLATARNDFIRKFGDRRLQDNWRNVSAPSNSPNTPQNGGVPVSITGTGTTQVNPDGTPGKPVMSPAEEQQLRQQVLVSKYRTDLPTTPEKLAASNKQIEAAMYELGGIYKELLKEKQRGYDTYAAEVARYPRGEHAPDADYLLYLYYKGLPDPAKAAQYAAALQRDFPASTYAKLIADPLYREHERALHNAVAARLEVAFGLYKDQFFTKSKAEVASIEQQYPKSDLNDRVAYLKMLLAIRTLPPVAARPIVAQFSKDFPDSPLQAQAQALAASFQKADAGQLNGALASTDKPVVSMFRPGEVNNRLAILYDEEAPVPVVTPTPAPAVPIIPAPTVPVVPGAGTPAGKLPANSATPVATPGTPAPAGKIPAIGTAPTTAPGAKTPGGTATTPTTPAQASSAPAVTPDAAPAVAYTTALSAAHAIVLVYPKGTAPVADLASALTAYNGRFFSGATLTVQPAQALGASQEMVVVRALPGSKVAQSYANKLRGPQSPLARLHGQGYQAIVISLANLTLLQAAGGDLAGYQQFYQKVYQ
ncbi:MAG: hypothetical protein ACRYFX_06215 [Janthinobacterium lividum]